MCVLSCVRARALFFALKETTWMDGWLQQHAPHTRLILMSSSHMHKHARHLSPSLSPLLPPVANSSTHKKQNMHARTHAL
jgi:hypothetical protein